MAEKKSTPKKAAPKKTAPKKSITPTKAVAIPKKKVAVRKDTIEKPTASYRKSLDEMLARYSDEEESDVSEVFTTMNNVIIKLTGDFKVYLWAIGATEMYKYDTLARLLENVDLSIDPVFDDEISKEIIRDNELDEDVINQLISLQSYCYLSCLIEKYNHHQIYYTDGTKNPNEGVFYDIFIPDEDNLDEISAYLKNAKRLVKTEDKNKKLFDQLKKEIDRGRDMIVIVGYSISY